MLRGSRCSSGSNFPGGEANGIERCGAPFPRTLPVDSGALQSARFLDHLQFSCTLHI